MLKYNVNLFTKLSWLKLYIEIFEHLPTPISINAQIYVLIYFNLLTCIINIYITYKQL